MHFKLQLKLGNVGLQETIGSHLGIFFRNILLFPINVINCVRIPMYYNNNLLDQIVSFKMNLCLSKYDK